MNEFNPPLAPETNKEIKDYPHKQHKHTLVLGARRIATDDNEDDEGASGRRDRVGAGALELGSSACGEGSVFSGVNKQRGRSEAGSRIICLHL